jgi:two-component system sensor histidine kinase QseC
MTRGHWSLRNRLIFLLAGLALAAWGGSSLWLYRTAQKQVSDLFDAALVETAHAVFAAVAHEGLGGDDEFEFDPGGRGQGERLFYQLRDRSGTIRYASPGAPPSPLASANADGFSDVVVDGVACRVYTLREPGRRAAIHVGQRAAEREALVRSMALRLLLPGVVVVLLLSAGVWFIVRRVTAPVISFSRSIDARAPGDSTPVLVDRLPSELLPVGHAVNRLLERVDEALLHERTLTADAAHELRTPLAALRAQAQVALRAREAGERNEALRALIGGVDRATRLVQTVLALARLDARSFDRAALPAISLKDVVAETVEGASADARAKSLRIDIDVPELSVRADPESLPVAVRNLIDNALRHAATRIRIAARSHDGRLVIVVQDDGPGMTAEQQARAFDRFYRGAGSDSGAGLGLALVKRVADMHGGTVRFAAGLDGQGLGVELVLPIGIAERS